MAVSRKTRGRISFRIKLPSVGFSQFLRSVVFDEEVFRLFVENTEGTLKAHGVELDPSVTQDALMRLRFTLIRARRYILREKVKKDRFEEVFGIFDPIFELQDVSLHYARGLHGIEVENCERSEDTNQGSNTEWGHYDSCEETRSDHFSNTTFESVTFTQPPDRFTRTPLLDALTLARLMTQFDLRLRQLGRY